MNSIRPSNVWLLLLLYFHFNYRNYFVCTNLMTLNKKNQQCYHQNIISNGALITILMFWNKIFCYKIIIDDFKIVNIIELKWNCFNSKWLWMLNNHIESHWNQYRCIKKKGESACQQIRNESNWFRSRIE